MLAWLHETNNGEGIVVHSDDIRAIQLAKAAPMPAPNCSEAAVIANCRSRRLAGGFGSYIDSLHAMISG
ncbi:MAG: hypothetical protein R2932_09780 [Caldilineaceae bacterium]